MSNDVTPSQLKAKNTARNAGPHDVLRFRQERLTFDRHYFPSLGRDPIRVWTSDNYEVHGDGRQFVAVLEDGVSFHCAVQGVDEQDTVVLFKR